MPPKKKADAPSKKTVEKKKEKVIEDKTFGLKNKKGKKQQQFIKNVTSQVKYGGTVSKEKLASMEYQTKKEKEQMKKENSELGSILKPVAVTQHVSKDADPKSVLCVFFKQGQCMKGDKCKFSHDLSLERKAEKKNLYIDSRDVTLENDTIDTWDENKLQEVVDKKHGSSEKSKARTEIVCKHFLQAIEKGLYGWFWTCPNGGDKCIYRHALPPGFVFKKAKKEDEDEEVITIEELVEQERNKLAASGKPLTKVTLETFLRWKERKLKEKQDKEAADLAKKKEAFKAGKTLGVSGREVFEFNPTLVMEGDDDDDGGEVFVHHYNKITMVTGKLWRPPTEDEAASEGIDLTGISMATGMSLATGGDELLGAVGGYSLEDVNIDEELFEQELNDNIPVDEELFNEEITDMTINDDINDEQ